MALYGKEREWTGARVVAVIHIVEPVAPTFGQTLTADIRSTVRVETDSDRHIPPLV